MPILMFCIVIALKWIYILLKSDLGKFWADSEKTMFRRNTEFLQIKETGHKITCQSHFATSELDTNVFLPQNNIEYTVVYFT